MTELAVYQPQSVLTEQMDFARAVVQRPDGAAQSLLPQAYRDNPANVLLAVGLGQGMGLSPAESLYRIDVIQGKPCAAAELIASNVRKAGHKLRIKVTEDPPAATCTIIRADDPDEPITVTRDMAWAQKMGLSTKDNYKKQPSTMLSWRAISACARLACSEALYGVAYTPDEFDDMPRAATTTAEQVAPAADRMRGLLGTETSSGEDPQEVTHASPEESPLLNTSSALAKQMFALFNEAELSERDDRLRYVSSVIGRDVASSSEMTDDDARAVILQLRADEAARPAQAEIVEGE